MAPYRLNLPEIEMSLLQVQQEFPKINEILHSRRDSMLDEVVENMMDGYTFVDTAINDNIDLFDLRNVHHLLELNHIVLCGLAPQVRNEHRKHLDAAAQRFYHPEQDGYDVDAILEWHRKHKDDSPWKRAAGVYVRILSQPQLYIEGNHRTGALIMSYLLARDGKPPFVLTVENAKAYFDPSSLMKETKKTMLTLLAKLPRMKKQFAGFLKDQASEKYLRKIA